MVRSFKEQVPKQVFKYGTLKPSPSLQHKHLEAIQIFPCPLHHRLTVEA